MIDEPTYDRLVQQLYREVLAATEDVDPDVLEFDGVAEKFTLTAASGEKCIVNTQRAVRQVWVAGAGQGLHFDYDEARGAWTDDKGRGVDLRSWIAEVARRISGVDLDLS